MIRTPRWQPGPVSVIIPTYNRVAILQRVLAGFAQQTLPCDRFEVIVCDDGSTDATVSTVSAYQAQAPYRLALITGPNSGPAAARNRGLDRATGDIVVFVDDDCIPTPTLLARHVESHQAERLAVIGRIVWHPARRLTRFMRFLDESIFTYRPVRVPYDAPFTVYYTGNASVARAAAQAIGGFDTSFPRAMHEDIDFAYRLRCHGVRFIYEAGAIVLHDRSADLPTFLANQYGKGREMVRFWRKHPELQDFTPLVPISDPRPTIAFFATALSHAFSASVGAALQPQPNDPPTGDGLAHEQSTPLDQAFPNDDTTSDDMTSDGDALPNDIMEPTWAWFDPALVPAAVEAARLRAELAAIDRQRRQAEQLQTEHEQLKRQYAQQTAWTLELATRLAQPRWRRVVAERTRLMRPAAPSLEASSDLPSLRRSLRRLAITTPSTNAVAGQTGRPAGWPPASPPLGQSTPDRSVP